VLAELKKLGYEDGRNLRIVIRGAEMKYDRLPMLAADLVQMNPDVIVSIDTPPTRAAIAATRQIPIVNWAGHPIATGFVNNLAHPGGNVTGASAMVSDIVPKRLQMAVPAMQRVAALFNPDDPLATAQRVTLERARPQLNIELRLFPVRVVDELGAIFDELTKWHADGVFWLSGQGEHLHQAVDRPRNRATTSGYGGAARPAAAWWVAFLWGPRRQPVSTRCGLCRQDTWRCQTGRPARPAAGQDFPIPEPQDRADPGADHPARGNGER
jgi:ABC transporter substrate binding protein